MYLDRNIEICLRVQSSQKISPQGSGMFMNTNGMLSLKLIVNRCNQMLCNQINFLFCPPHPWKLAPTPPSLIPRIPNHGCSSPLYKMAQCLHIAFIILPCSLSHLWITYNTPYKVNVIWIVVTFHHSRNNDKEKKFIHVHCRNFLSICNICCWNPPTQNLQIWRADSIAPISCDTTHFHSF